MKKEKILDLVGLLISLAFLIFTTRPLFHPGLFPTADNIPVVRIEEMKKELDAGQFPVRYVKDLGKGHGYMLFNFYAPLPFYTGALLNKLGVNPVGALKRTYLLAFLLGAVFMYFLGKKCFGRWGGVVASGFYNFTPFLGMDTYSRGGLGEVWAISLIPAVLYLVSRYLEKENMLFLFFSSLSIAILILSHNLTSYMAIFFIIIFLFCLKQKRGNVFSLLAPFFFGLGFSAFFWLPAFIEKNSIWVWFMDKNISEFKNFFLPYEILYSPKSFFQISYLTPWYGLSLIWVMMGVVLLRKEINRIFIWCFILSLISLFLVLPISRPVWNGFAGILSIFQFPWRFLTIYTIFVPLLVGFLVSGKGLGRYLIGIVILSLALLTSLNSFRPLTYEFVDKYRAEDPCGTTWKYEYLPVWTKICLKQFPDVKFDFFEGKGEIKTLVNQSRYYKFEVEAKEDSLLRVNEYYYPGWKAFVNGREVSINYSNLYGIISLPIKNGQNIVELRLLETSLEKSANFLSLASLIVLVLGTIFSPFFKIGQNNPIFDKIRVVEKEQKND